MIDKIKFITWLFFGVLLAAIRNEKEKPIAFGTSYDPKENDEKK